MNMPNFLVIGANKAGTTALYLYLKQHPQIFMSSIKEPSFFMLDENPINRDRKDMPDSMISDLGEYLKLFESVTNEKAIGEASTAYLPDAHAVKRIFHHAPKMRMIAVLRDPAERAYSAHSMYVQRGWESIYKFEKAIAAERKPGNPRHYVRLGFYHEQLCRYFEVFEKNQFKIFLYEDFKQSPVSVLKEIFKFLEVDESFSPKFEIRSNITETPKNKFLHACLIRMSPVVPEKMGGQMISKLMQRNLTTGKPKLNPKTRKMLVETYRPDILKLQELICRDLSNWLVF